MPHTILTVTLLTLVALPAYAQDVPTIVEGHVFNKWTGVPLKEARIQVVSVNEAGAQNNFVVTTDGSGFYSVVLDPGFNFRNLWATCGTRTTRGELRDARSDIALPDPSVDFARRDVYLDVTRRRGFSTCLHLAFPL